MHLVNIITEHSSEQIGGGRRCDRVVINDFLSDLSIDAKSSSKSDFGVSDIV